MGWSWTQKDQDDLQRDTDKYERPDEGDVRRDWDRDTEAMDEAQDRASAREAE